MGWRLTRMKTWAARRRKNGAGLDFSFPRPDMVSLLICEKNYTSEANEVMLSRCFIFLFVLLAAGCLYLPRNLPAQLGWSVEQLGENDFRITPLQPAEGRGIEAFAVAGDIAASRGFRSFELIPDRERPNSGTEFDWGQTFGGQPGILAWRIGTSFRIHVFSISARGKPILDARKCVEEFERWRKEVAATKQK